MSSSSTIQTLALMIIIGIRRIIGASLSPSIFGHMRSAFFTFITHAAIVIYLICLISRTDHPNSGWRGGGSL